jgi:Na+-driven multidrug efflux pump
MACPNLYIRIFMSPTPEILQTAPSIVHAYALSFLLLPFNIFSTYYFQAIMRAKAAFIVSVARGLVVGGVLIMALPALADADSLWFAMPVTELLVMLYAASATVKYTRAL